MLDPRADASERLVPPSPLPHVSRKALRRVKDALPAPQQCNCCGSTEVALVENSEIYNGRTYGEWPYAYLCRGCRAYVGLHPSTDLPLGTLADAPLRAARNACKKPFEEIWRSRRLMSRKDAYAWLAQQLGIPPEQCHFGLFDVELCRRAEQVCGAYLSKHLR